MPVTRDSTSLQYIPASLTEWNLLVNGTGVGALSSLYLCQDASSPAVDGISAINLAGSASGFQQPVTGWTAKAITYIDTSGAQLLNTSAAGLPDLSTTCMALLVYMQVTNSPAGTRSLLNFGPGSTQLNNVTVEMNSSTQYVYTDGTNTGTGSVNHGTSVIPVLMVYNKTAGTTTLYVGYTYEKIVKPFATPAGGSKGLWFGSSYANAPSMGIVWGGALFGAAAEITDTQVTSLFGRLTTGNVTSVALMPPGPSSLFVGNTLPMTATANFASGGTANVSSDPNTTWTSTNPAVATVSSSGLVTAVSTGTATITAAYGGQTSAGNVLTISSSGHWPFTTHLQEFRTSIQRAGFVEVTLTATPATTEWTALELWVTGSDDRAPSRNRQ